MSIEEDLEGARGEVPQYVCWRISTFSQKNEYSYWCKCNVFLLYWLRRISLVGKEQSIASPFWSPSKQTQYEDGPNVVGYCGIRRKKRYQDLNNTILYLVWYRHARRAETLSRELGAKLVFVYKTRLRSFWLRPLGYIIQTWETLRLLEAERPSAVITQSPPVFAPLIVALWCKIRGRKRVSYIIDCHPGTFYHHYWRWAIPLMRQLARGGVISLLCNEDAQDYLSKWNANYLFLPDGLPDLSSVSGTVGTEGDARIAVISTLANDEPICELLEAARLTPHVTYYLTGDLQRATKEMLAMKPENVIFTGYLTGGAYNGLLHNVQGIMVLSNLQPTLSCGAFEALSLAKPTILSNTPEQRKWFSAGFIMVENTPEGIAQGVDELLSEYATYSRKAKELREEYLSTRQPKLGKLTSLLKS